MTKTTPWDRPGIPAQDIGPDRQARGPGAQAHEDPLRNFVDKNSKDRYTQGDKLRKAREDSGESMGETALALGVDVAMVSAAEAGLKNASPEVFTALVDRFLR